MIYLIDPVAAGKEICRKLGCSVFCEIKPCYGVPNDEI